MKAIKMFLFTVLFTTSISAQIMPASDWDALIMALMANDWPKAHELSGKHLKKHDSDTSGAVARLRYMYLYSLAGLVGTHQVERSAALKKAKKLEGKAIEMPSHPVEEKCMFNCIWYSTDADSSESGKTLRTVSTNETATYIHAFESYQFVQNIDLKLLKGKMIALGGKLSTVELQGQFLSAFRIVVRDTYYSIDE